MALRVLAGVQLDGHGALQKEVWELLLPADLQSRMYITSSYRAGPAYHGSTDDHGAQDIAAPMTDQGHRDMRDAAKLLYDRFGTRYVEIIHSTPFNDDQGFYVKNGQKMPGGGVYAGQTAAEHLDHIHTANKEGVLRQIIAELKQSGPTPAPQPPPSTGGNPDCFGWDASNHDHGRGPVNLVAAKADGIKFFTHKCSEGLNNWYLDPYYAAAMGRAKAAGIAVMGAYFVLHPGNAALQAEQFFNRVNTLTPWWKDVPWIWQLDAEKFSYMDRAPNLSECNTFMDRIHQLSGGYGYHVAYAPKWVYGDALSGFRYDLWSSNYPSESTAGYRTIWNQVGGSGAGFAAYSGKQPMIWQYSEHSTIGGQSRCDANKFRGTVEQLISLATSGKGTSGTEGGDKMSLDTPLNQGPTRTPLPDDFEYADQYASTAIAWSWKGIDDANRKLDALSTGTGVSEDQFKAWVKEAVKDALREGTE